jgi:hypothetical protein
MSYDDPRRTDWHNIPKPERKGLQFKEMTGAQQELCRDLLKAGLSEAGFAKAMRIMSLESNLREGEKNVPNSPLRDPGRYFLTIFGTPGATGSWGWSFEGHHLSMNFAVQNGHVTAETPSFWGANPATVGVFVEGGPKVGVRTLTEEEQPAFDLVASLSDDQKKQAILSATPPDDYRNAGNPASPQFAREGIAYSQLTPEQQKTLKTLLTSYSGHLAAPLAGELMSAIEKAGWENVYVGWEGATKPGVGHYYRIQGPSFVLELVNIQSDPQGNPANHIHSVWRDPNGDFALPKK